MSHSSIVLHRLCWTCPGGFNHRLRHFIYPIDLASVQVRALPYSVVKVLFAFVSFIIEQKARVCNPKIVTFYMISPLALWLHFDLIRPVDKEGKK